MSDFKAAVLQVIEPVTQVTLGSLCLDINVQETAGTIHVTLIFPFPNKGFWQRLDDVQKQRLYDAAAGKQVEVEAQHESVATLGERLPSLAKVKNVIAVSSGKGGVGKSTTAVNLALALQQEGAKVALLDADIYGPSLPLMLGCEGQTPALADGEKMMIPISTHGLVVNSVGFLVAADTATVWRGPMAAGVLQQLLRDTIWGEADYLIVDMPPGTGDIQLTLAQVAPVSAAVIVTTPQTIALADAVKGIAMFQKVDVPVAGVIENMSFHACSNCGHHDYLFGKDGGKRIADLYDVPLLGALPLDRQIGDDVDDGNPTVVAEPDSLLATIYRDTAAAMAYHVWLGQQQQADPVAIDISDD
ncbi:iron-sulfur cluster carrier protein ApbC [Neiella marina]|uniref:Iron-sulfur cluster carrier protein n=1 Tax=Neiella holothuriorum TaxID=2870530 RepID=A0ABS7ED96_9GAMM|nr:iron-sulfur cluster carrier protein ApbC [Neiella holothuriorum]MBW8190205.1 iron-sulfur cluster carrier protein ApbC [Neiella holothuriorum]